MVDNKVTAFPSVTPSANDAIYIIDDPLGAPLDGQATMAAVASFVGMNIPANGLAVGGTQLVASGGNVGIGVAAPASKLQVNYVFAGSNEAIQAYVNTNPVGAVNVNQYGILSEIDYLGTGVNAGSVAGIRGVASIKTSYVNVVEGVDGYAEADTTDITGSWSLYGVRAQVGNINTGRVAHAIGFRALNPINSGGGTIDYVIGAYIGSQQGVATASAAIHIEGSGANNSICFGNGTSNKYAEIYSPSANKITISVVDGLCINTEYPLGTVDISEGGLALVLGADNGIHTRTNATTKYSKIGGAHYTNVEEPVCVFQTQSDNGYNILYIGGGSTVLNAATYITFMTAANGTTVIGTERMRIDDQGRVGINDSVPAQILDVTGNIDCTGVYMVDDVQVVNNRVIDIRCNDAINPAAWDATTAGVLTSLRDAMITHGLIAAA